MSKKILIPSLVVVIIALIAVISFLIYKQNSTPNDLRTDQNQSAIVPTAPVLSTYKNPQFPNFSFDYPSNYKVDFKNSNPALNSSVSTLNVLDNSNNNILNFQFEYEGGGGGFGCWSTKQDNPKFYLDSAGKNWYLAVEETSTNSGYIFIQKSDIFTKGTQQFNEAIAFNNDQISLNNMSKLDPSKIIGCESTHGTNYTKTTFSDPVAPNQDPNRIAFMTIKTVTKPTITKEISDILDSIKGLEDQSSSVSTPAPTNTSAPSSPSTNSKTTPVPTTQPDIPITSNDLVETKCDKYKVKVGDKIVCILNFSKVVPTNQIPTIKFALASPAGSSADLGSVLSVCNMPSTSNPKSINCTFDTKAIKIGSYSTSIEINGDFQLGVTDNITITK